MSFWVNNSTPFSLTTSCPDPLTKSVWVRRENLSKLGHHVLYLERVQNYYSKLSFMILLVSELRIFKIGSYGVVLLNYVHRAANSVR